MVKIDLQIAKKGAEMNISKKVLSLFNMIGKNIR